MCRVWRWEHKASLQQCRKGRGFGVEFMQASSVEIYRISITYIQNWERNKKLNNNQSMMSSFPKELKKERAQWLTSKNSTTNTCYLIYIKFFKYMTTNFKNTRRRIFLKIHNDKRNRWLPSESYQYLNPARLRKQLKWKITSNQICRIWNFEQKGLNNRNMGECCTIHVCN